MTQWGTIVGRPLDYVQITADGHLLRSRIADYDRYKIAGVCYHYEGLGDVQDVQDLQKSELHDIVEGDIIIGIKLDQKFMNTWLQERKSNTNYVLVLVPNGINMNQFSTMRQAMALGVKPLNGAIGPP